MTVEPYARQALAAGRYREAIKHFRTLSASEPPSVWAEGLAAAYRGRALELSAKGMPREALAIWENREWRCPGARPEPEQIALLLELGEYEDALAAYGRLQSDAPPQTLNRARTHLAATYLSEPESLDGLDPDDPVRTHGEAARAALTVYCDGDGGAASTHLQAIPYRSPYRDLVIVLKALIHDQGDGHSAERRLGGIETTSPFAPLAEAARRAGWTEAELLPTFHELSEPQQRLVASLRGWPPQRLALVRTLFHPDAADPSADLATTLVQWRHEVGDTWFRQQRIRLVFHDALSRGIPPTPPEDADELECALLHAWHTEAWHGDDPAELLAAWQAVIEALRAAGEPSAGDGVALRIAAIQRHLADDLALLETPLAAEAETALTESVALDPEHRHGHELLIQRHRACGRLTQARRALDRALARWPEDRTLLQDGLEIALEGEALDDALEFARRILVRDPINRRARHVLHEALVARARAACTEGDPQAARAALDQAEAWAESPPARAQIDRLRTVVDASCKGGHDTVGSPRQAAGEGPALGHALALAVEAQLAGQPPETVLARSGLRPPKRLERDELLDLCRGMQELAQEAPEALDRALECYAPALRRAHRIRTLGLEDFATVCEALRAAGQDELRGRFAREALRHRLEDPLFLVHSLEARYRRGQNGQPSSRELDQLRRAFRRARRDDDKRTAHRAGVLIKQWMPDPATGD